MKKYYLRRPVDIGTCPKGFISFKNYDDLTYVSEVGRNCWGEVTYDRELRKEEIDRYELYYPAPTYPLVDEAEQEMVRSMTGKELEQYLEYAKQLQKLIIEVRAERAV